MTPDEYCDTIRDIAFDRETTKAAFEAGRAAESAERDDDLTAVYMAGIERGRDSLRKELAKQEPVAWWTGNSHLVATILDTDKPKSTPLFAHPIPPPDVRELVEAADAVVKRWDSPLWSQQGHTGDFIARLRAALTKHREQS